ncbi:hypothetical protein E1287_35045 [Actinomadura sp. KC06]|uniref:hypothetical protein n=1 Tax=Actinomadura sp. KC06 TaxID=2530369 RepID=UPI001048E55D|nr:hypothetical protein [Actinomadura sp. KC06]TDD27194.1 hypothetical protein E1287_35045 [Actinomadura sp. KC06]
MSKALVSARREPSSSDRYAWVWVAPLGDGTFRVSTVEISKHIVDEDICFFEDDIERVHIGTFTDISEVDDLVRGLGVDPDELDPPWKNDFPL